MKKYSEFMKNEIKAIIESDSSDKVAKYICDVFIEDFETAKTERQTLQKEIERLTNLNRYLSDHLSDLLDSSSLLEDVRTSINFEDRVEIKSIEFEDMFWKVAYELGDIVWRTEFNFEFCGREDLPGKIAEHIHIVAQAIS